MLRLIWGLLQDRLAHASRGWTADAGRPRAVFTPAARALPATSAPNLPAYLQVNGEDQGFRESSGVHGAQKPPRSQNPPRCSRGTARGGASRASRAPRCPGVTPPSRLRDIMILQQPRRTGTVSHRPGGRRPATGTVCGAWGAGDTGEARCRRRGARRREARSTRPGAGPEKSREPRPPRSRGRHTRPKSDDLRDTL
jgi:hypothetical protein